MAIDTSNGFLVLVDEVHRWSTRNFGSADGLGAAASWLGVIEELMGETHANDCDADLLDALADGTIFLADFCGRVGMGKEARCLMQQAIISPFLGRGGFDYQSFVATIAPEIGNVCHIVLKSRQGIRSQTLSNNARLDSALAWILRNVTTAGLSILAPNEPICAPNDLFLAHVLSTWETVKPRDWKKNPGDGINA